MEEHRPTAPARQAGSPAGPPEALELVLEPRARDLDGLAVARLLPAVQRRMVGPFIFLDHFGPAELRPPRALDVRPHPHIGLATVTYLLEGEILHRDSLGSAQRIEPGAVNWMTAGRGIVHSERTPPERRGAPSRLHGLQLWVALPSGDEEAAPAFHHHPAASLPILEGEGARLRLLAGRAFGVRSPVRAFSPLLLVDAALEAGALLPLPAERLELGAYVVEGALGLEGHRLGAGRLHVLRPGAGPALRAVGPTRVLLLGGEPLGEPRHAWWNFVSTSRERIEAARADWAEGRFPTIPGDDQERAALPSRPPRLEEPAP